MEENANSMPACSGNQFDWCHIFKASRQALQPEKIFLASLGLMITFVIGALLLDRVWISVGWGLDQETLRASPLMVEPPARKWPRWAFSKRSFITRSIAWIRRSRLRGNSSSPAGWVTFVRG